MGLTKANLDIETKTELGSWCSVDVKNAVIRAQIIHIGRGRFRIVQDNQDNAFVGKVVDASDVIQCER